MSLLVAATLLVGVSIGSDSGEGSSEAVLGASVTTMSPPPLAGSESPAASGPILDVLAVQSVSCSTQLASHPCELLVDGDRATAWNAPDGGEGARVIVTLEEATQLSALVLTNHAEDESLMRNARIATAELHFGGTTQVVRADLDGSHGPYRIEIPLIFTDSISVHVESTHPAEHYAGQEPFSELALAEIRVVGYRQG